MLTSDEAWEVLRSAERLVSAEMIEATLFRLAGEISARLAATNPVVVSVLGGAVVFSGHLLPLLRFPLEFDFVHVTRYGDRTRGGEVEWKVRPGTPILGRTVLVIDDILDEGVTLAAIRGGLLAQGACAVYSVVLADKDIGRPKPVTADFVGVRLPNRYVFGFGMDVRGAWRNLPEIYALKS